MSARRAAVVGAWLSVALGCGSQRNPPPETTIPTASTPPASSSAPPETRPKGDELHQFLERARICTGDDVCEHLGDYCHRGCSVTVNRASAAEARKRLDAEPRTCVMDCPPVEKPACVAGHCISPDRKY